MEKIYHISQVAERINRDKQTIRRWIKEGLLQPERDDRGWMIFTDGDIKRLEEIKQEKIKIQKSGVGYPEEEEDGSKE
jgi:DNA-binding transcriptional MerR regulator